MVGNDVVDLMDPETRADTQNRRFDQRVFCSRERADLARSRDPHTLRWMMWAAKESAFKLASRQRESLVFAHSRFETRLGGDGRGEVVHPNGRCRIGIRIVGSAVHAVAFGVDLALSDVVCSAVRIAPECDPSAEVRSLAVSLVADRLGRDPAVCTVTRCDRGLPLMRVQDRIRGCVSLSHHGEWVAAAWVDEDKRAK